MLIPTNENQSWETDCHRQREVVNQGGDVLGDLNNAILEPRKESLGSRRRRAALEDVMDDLESDFEEE